MIFNSHWNRPPHIKLFPWHCLSKTIINTLEWSFFLSESIRGEMKPCPQKLPGKCKGWKAYQEHTTLAFVQSQGKNNKKKISRHENSSVFLKDTLHHLCFWEQRTQVIIVLCPKLINDASTQPQCIVFCDYTSHKANSSPGVSDSTDRSSCWCNNFLSLWPAC